MTIKLHECFQLVASSQTTARCGKATPAIAELWNAFQRSVPNRSLVRKAWQGWQRSREGTKLIGRRFEKRGKVFGETR